MRQASAEVEIGAPAEKVWEVLADFGSVSVFNPSVTESHLTTDHASGLGAIRHCDLTVPGASIEERIVDWEDGRSLTVEIHGGTRNPFAKALATMAVEPLDTDRSVAKMSIEWRAKGGPIAGLLDRALQGQNRKTITGVLAGLKHYVETGDPVAGRQTIDRSAVRVG